MSVRHIRIGLVFNDTLGYSSGVLRGIKQFAQTKPDWILAPLITEGLTAATLRAAWSFPPRAWDTRRLPCWIVCLRGLSRRGGPSSSRRLPS